MRMKLKSISTTALIGALVLFGSRSALADSLVMSNYRYTPALTLSVAPPAYSGGVGGFSAVYTPTGGSPTSFVAFCVDLFQTFSFGSPFIVTPVLAQSLYAPERFTLLDRLYTQHYAPIQNGASNSTDSAAFQLAVWEIIRETGSTGFSLSGGTFTASATPSTNTGDLLAISRANTWLSDASLGGASGDYILTALTSGTRQDQMMATPVPEPETYAMLLAGLGLMGFVIRRRNARTQ